MELPSNGAILDLVHGRLRVRGWPSRIRPPFGLCASDAAWFGLPRLRWRVRQVLADAGVPFVDHIAPLALSDDAVPAPPDREPALLPTWLAHDGRGVMVGFPEVERHDLTVAAVHRLRARALVVVRDSGAASAFADALRRRDGRRAVDVVIVGEAARTTHWRARRHDLLAVDRPEQMSRAPLSSVLDQSPARWRLGFVDDGQHRELLEWSAAIGPVLAVVAPSVGARHVELRLPLAPVERIEHDRAWDVFLCAYDRFAAARPGAGFGAFVRQARGDPLQRDAVLAWHRAARIAAWNVSKAATVAALLERHREDRVLVFTPDRASAYELSRAHLIAAVTAELGRRERTAILSDFAVGRLRALAGPRLLDLGVPEGAAQVGILVGGGFGAAQRATRARRVAESGVLYELVTQDTAEVGRARRNARSHAASPAVDHDVER